MSGIYLTSEELTALEGAPWLVCQLYVFGVRPQMDYASGLVGRFSKVSWHGFAREVRVESAPGIKEVLPDKSAMRRAGVHLVKRGLVAIESEGDRLVLRCLLARLNSSVQIKADTKATQLRGTVGGRVVGTKGADFKGLKGNGLAKADTQPSTHKNGKPTHIRESEDSLSLHTAHEKFVMNEEWVPVKNEFVDQEVRRRGIDVDRIGIDDRDWILREFVLYWVDRPDKQLTQRGWEALLAGSVAHHVLSGRVCA